MCLWTPVYTYEIEVVFWAASSCSRLRPALCTAGRQAFLLLFQATGGSMENASWLHLPLSGSNLSGVRRIAAVRARVCAGLGYCSVVV